MRHHVQILRSLLFTSALCFGLVSFVAAQEITGSIVGTIKDANGAAVSGATVTLTDVDRKIVVRSLTSNENGEFSAPLVPVGKYDVTVEAPNFKKHLESGVKLDVNQRRTLDIVLEAGNIAEVVTVESQPLQVDTQSAAAGNIINGTQVRELSLNNRNFVQLITLSPGVASDLSDQVYVGTTNPSGQSNALNIAVNGARVSSNTYTVDGADTTDRGSNLTIQTYPSVDAIGEFKISRSLYPAETGRSSGGQVNVITRSGARDFHGSIYEFFRNDKLNANAFLTNRTVPAPFGLDSSGKAKRAPLRYNNYGGTFGGPVIIPKIYRQRERDKTFFFFSEEQRRTVSYPSQTFTFPSTALKQGIFPQDVCLVQTGATCPAGQVLPAGTPLPQNLRSPLAAAYIQDIYGKLPDPGNATGSIFFPGRNVFNFRQELLRIDHRFSNNVSAFYRFEKDTIPTTEPFALFTGTGIPGVSTTATDSPGKTHVGRVTWIQNPTSVWEFGFAYSYGAILSQLTGLLNESQSPDIVKAYPAFAFQRTRGRVPTLAGNGFSGLVSFGPYNNFSSNWVLNSTFSKVKGAHTMKFGLSYNHYRKFENSLPGDTNEVSIGTFPSTPRPTGTSTTNQLWANFLMGKGATVSQTQLDTTVDLRSITTEGFAQDEWRFRRNLTLYYGVRMSYFGQPWDTFNRLSNFVPALFNRATAFQVLANGNRVPSSGDPLDGIIVNNQVTTSGGTLSPYGKRITNSNLDFAPRVGLAWDPFKKGKTSVRMGYGIYHDQVSLGPLENQAVLDPPFQVVSTLTGVSIDNPLAGVTSVSAAVPNLRGIEAPWKTPYAQQWSFDVQQELLKNLVVTAGYFGSRGVHLPGLVDINNLPPGFALTQTCRTNNVDPPTFGPCQAAGTPFTSATQELILNQIRPYRGYGAISMLATQFISNYHSLQVSAQKRFTAGNQVNLAYTWSKNLTNNLSEGSNAPQNTYDLRSDYGRANLDRHHILTVNYIYELQVFKNRHGFTGKFFGGWEASGIFTYFTGRAFTATTSNLDPAGLGLLGSSPSSARPDVICDPNSGAQTYPQWINKACLVDVPAGQLRVGNSARNILNGPPTTRVDMSLLKNIKFSESKRLQLRWEVFNVFNHTNFTTFASTNITSSVFGQIGATRDPRTMQLAAKFYF
jgi:Carboxypeptidase regulatory-like domain